MIVSCSRCSSRYRVSEDKLPTGGGNIQCPSCGHVFFVEPPKPAAELLQALPDGASADLEDDGAATSVGMTAAQLLAGAQAQAAAPTPPAEPEPAARPKSDAWKLKTSFGLVYDFPDTGSLQTWLSGREDLDGYLLSRDGAEYKPLGQWKEVMNPALRAKVTAAAAGLTRKSAPVPSAPAVAARNEPPRPDAASSGEPRRPADAKKSNMDPPVEQATSQTKASLKGNPASRPASPKPKPAPRPRPRPGSRGAEPAPASKAPLLIGLLVLVLAVVAVLHFTKIVDFGRFIDRLRGEDAVVTAPQQPGAAPGTAAPPTTAAAFGGPAQGEPPATVVAAPSPFGQSDHVETLLEQADKEMRERDYDQAIATLNSARNLAPNEPKIFRLLERAWNRQGNREEARVARERYEALEATP